MSDTHDPAGTVDPVGPPPPPPPGATADADPVQYARAAMQAISDANRRAVIKAEAWADAVPTWAKREP